MIPNAVVDVKHFSLTCIQLPTYSITLAKKPLSESSESGLNVNINPLMMGQQIKQNRKEVCHTAAKHEQMPDRVVVRKSPPYVENRAKRIR